MHTFKGYSRHRDCHPRNLRRQGGSNGRRKKTEAEGNDAGHNDHALPSLLETFSWIMLVMAIMSAFVVIKTPILVMTTLSFAAQTTFMILPFVCIICTAAILDTVIMAAIFVSIASNELLMRYQQQEYGQHQQGFSPLRKLMKAFLKGVCPLYVTAYHAPAVNDSTFYEAGKRLMKRRGFSRESIRKFKSHFGATPSICADIWQMLNPREHISAYAKPVHLLWGLMLIKIYATEEVLSGIAGVTEKTYRKWAWIFVKATAELSYVLVSL